MTRTLTVPRARVERWLDGFAERHGLDEVRAQGDSVQLSGHDGATARVRPLWPGATFDADPVTELLAAVRTERRLGVVALRADSHAVAVWDGRAVTAWARKTHYVQSRTAAGGWSQQRFARRRENQAKAAYEKAAGDVARILEPEIGSLDAVLAAGNPQGIRAVLADARCRRTAALAGSVPLPRLELHDTTRDAVTDLVARLLGVVVEIDEP